MTKHRVYTLSVKSRKSLNNAEDYLAAVRLQCRMLPEYIPNKFDWVEPLKQVFEPTNLNSLVFKNGNVDDVWWKRTDKPKSDGFWITRWCNSDDSSDVTHSTININFKEITFQDNLIDYLKQASIFNLADIGFIDSVADEYKQIALVNSYAPFGGNLNISTKLLRNWLPEMPWAVVFGSAYIRLFGKDKLLTTPAFKVEEIGDELVFIQLTPLMEDIHEQYEQVMQARSKAKKHLGEECFFKQELVYNFNANPDKAGKVFKVPMFDFLEDKI